MSRFFDGVDDVLTFTGAGATSTWSAACWIWPNTNNVSYPGLFFGSVQVEGVYRHGAAGANQGKLNYFFSGADHFANTQLALQTWHRVAVTVSAGSVTFYVNGVSDGTAASAPALNINVLGRGDVSGEFYDGALAHFCLYNRVLTLAELEIVWRLGGFALPNGLVRYFELFGTLSPEPDWSGNNAHATVTGTTTADHDYPGVSAQAFMLRDRVQRIVVVPAPSYNPRVESYLRGTILVR